ncbi:cytochrome P450 [Aureobasidium sp. EXF-10728]|nr:cytochrome P450 [Aureobasidium sp. EXF-10728]
MNSSSLLLLSCGLSIFYLVTTIILRKISVLRFKSSHECLDPPALPQRERIIGLDLLKAGAAAVKAKNSLECAVRRIESTANTFSNTIVGLNIITTIDPANIQCILAQKFTDYDLGGRIYAWGPLVGKGVFTSDGPEWAHRRAIIRPNFTKQQVASLEMFERHFGHLLTLLPRDGSTVDLQKLFFSMTLDSATEFLFGQSVGAQGAGHGSEADQFQRAFDFAQHQMPDRNRLGVMNLFVPNAKFKAACKVVHTWADRYVQQWLRNRASEKIRKSPDDNSKYVCLEQIADQVQDPRQLRDEMLNVLLAGRDTTAGLLSNAFHVLSRHPEVWKRLRAEVDTLEGRLPTYEDLKGLRYLKCVLSEVLRLYPPVPTNARCAKVDTVLPTGGGPTRTSPVFVPKGSIVVYSIYALHRRHDTFGPTAKEFIPERWSTDSPDGPLRPGWGYIPFSGGPRICVGQQYALTEASYTIVRMCQNFTELQSRDQGPWREGLGLTLCSGEGTKVGLIPL